MKTSPSSLTELRQRLLHAFGRSVALLSDALGATLKEAQETIRMAYFHEMKARGLKLRAISEQLDVSERHVKRLQKEFRETFLDADREYDLPVRIEFLLWATPVSRKKVCQLLKRFESDASVIEAAIDTLITDLRVEERDGELHVRQAVHSKLDHTLIARVGGLSSFLSNLTDAAFARFLDEDPRAFARTMSFLIQEDDIATLKAHFIESLIPLIQTMDERANAGTEPTTPFRLSLCWAPYEYIRNRMTGDPPE